MAIALAVAFMLRAGAHQFLPGWHDPWDLMRVFSLVLVAISAPCAVALAYVMVALGLTGRASLLRAWLGLGICAGFHLVLLFEPGLFGLPPIIGFLSALGLFWIFQLPAIWLFFWRRGHIAPAP